MKITMKILGLNQKNNEKEIQYSNLPKNTMNKSSNIESQYANKPNSESQYANNPSVETNEYANKPND